MAITSGFSQADLMKMAPADIERKRKLAEALIAAGSDTSPIGHWTQGAARLAQALSGKFQESRLDKAQQAGMADAARATNAVNWGSVFGGNTGAGTDAPAYPSSVAQGGSSTSPAATGVADPSQIKKGLMDRGLPEQVADGFIMNFQDESGMNPGVNEKNPTVPGSRGGFGLYQLTGPRRRAYESFAQERGVDPSNVDAQLDFLVTELKGPEQRAAQSIMSAPDSGSAAAAIAKNFLRPAQEHLDRRVAKYTSGQQPVQVASLDPSAGMGQALAGAPVSRDAGPMPMRVPMDSANAGAPLSPENASAGLPFAPSSSPQPNSMAQALIQGAQGQQGALSPQGMAAHDKALGGILAGNQQSVDPQNAKMAQALLGGGQGQNYFPPAPDANRAPIPQPNAFPPAPQQPAPQDNIQQLMAVINHPHASREQKMMAMQALETMQARNDPANQLDMQYKQAQLDALKAKPKEKYDFITGKDGTILRADSSGNVTPVYGGGGSNFRTLSQDEAKQMGLPEGAYQVGPDKKVYKIGGEGTTVNIDQKTEGSFEKKLAENQATMFSDMMTEGQNAKSDLAVIGELGSVLQNQGGIVSGLSSRLAKYGIGGENISDVQAADALINKLIPTQRQAGSGSMSDRDVEMFRASLPSLWNSPEGNQKILGVMQGLAQYKNAQGDIASRVMNGEISRQKAVEELRALPNPLEEFRKAKTDEGTPPEGVDPADWKFLTPEERKLFQ